jgi:dTDP-4-amino-4,6-dideoxygalactose transaminase
MAFVTNGTIALQLAIRALNLSGQIITTPFTYVATSTSILWEGCTPVFVDIESNGFNIDADSIESVITRETSAILVTHCFGIPCDINRIQEIASRNKLKVIYDAAHCFGATYQGQSIFNFGDVSTCSFHATKLFHTVEGGGVFMDETIRKKVSLLRNFGHDGPERFTGIGINGKNSEFHAAMGLSVLPHMKAILDQRKRINSRYFELLSGNEKVTLVDPQTEGWNWAYCPVVFQSEESCLSVKENLEENEVAPRRYFYPSLEVLHGQFEEHCPNSRRTASRILCLPSFHELKMTEIDRICAIISNTLES